MSRRRGCGSTAGISSAGISGDVFLRSRLFGAGFASDSLSGISGEVFLRRRFFGAAFASCSLRYSSAHLRMCTIHGFLVAPFEVCTIALLYERGMSAHFAALVLSAQGLCGASRPAMADAPLAKKRRTMDSGAGDYPQDVEVLMDLSLIHI